MGASAGASSAFCIFVFPASAAGGLPLWPSCWANTGATLNAYSIATTADTAINFAEGLRCRRMFISSGSWFLDAGFKIQDSDF
jgi:hypothetical protein